MHVCKECGREGKSEQSLKVHVVQSHQVKFADYLIKHEHGGIRPVCQCGCEQEVNYFRGKFRSYLQGHFLRGKEYLYTDEVNEKRKNTCIKKYGGPSPACSEDVKKKIVRTNMEKYGGPSPSFSEEVRAKTIKTNLERFGAENPLQNKDILNKVKKTCIEKYGVDNVFSLDSVKEKIKKTNIEKYGFLAPTQNHKIAKKISKAKKISYEQIAIQSLKKGYIPSFNYTIYEHNRQLLKFVCIKHNITFESCVFNIQQENGNQCPKCKFIGISKQENEIFDFLNQYGVKNIIKNSRKIIPPKELDIFIPDKDVAIEYHGLYWHSEAFDKFNNKNLHYEKFQKCKEKGIKLLQFYEDEWKNKQDICESIIKNSLFLTEYKVSAKDCFIEGKEKTKEIKSFLNDNHLQGYCNFIKSFCLFHEKELVMLVTLRKPFTKNKSDSIEIARVVTKKNVLVRGGFSKLFKHVVKWSKEENYKKIITYSDCRYSHGKLYNLHGFEKKHHTGLDYFYTDLCKRYNRFKFCAQNGQTEKEVAAENNVYKIYGAGHFLWEKQI